MTQVGLELVFPREPCPGRVGRLEAHLHIIAQTCFQMFIFIKIFAKKKIMRFALKMACALSLFFPPHYMPPGFGWCWVEGLCFCLVEVWLQE